MDLLSPAQLDELTRDWTAKDKAKAWEQFKARTEKAIQAWYCTTPGRLCDGNPHEGYEYQHARADQWPPPGQDWFVWFIISGRGAGKTRTGAEWTRKISERVGQIAIIGRRGKDVKQVMVEGPSGLIAVCNRAGVGFDWYPSKLEFHLANGAKILGYSAEEPASVRGPEHGAGWLDEPAHMDLIEDVWDNLLYGMRMKGLPGGTKVLCTSTPLPTKWLKARLAEPKTRSIRVSSDMNRVNLDEHFIENVLDPRRGTRQGRQEIDGEILEDVVGALWKGEYIRRTPDMFGPEHAGLFDRIVVTIDPAGTNNRRSDETGIVIVGRIDNMAYVLQDVSGKYSPDGWAREADRAYQRWSADAIVAEKNYGGDMVKTTIEGVSRARVIVKTASRSKQLRAEPAVAMYERKLVWHNHGGAHDLSKLETEMTTWVPGKGDSPNRVDALVWALDELMDNVSESGFASPASTGVSKITGSFQQLTPQDVLQGFTPQQIVDLAAQFKPNPKMHLPTGFVRMP